MSSEDLRDEIARLRAALKASELEESRANDTKTFAIRKAEEWATELKKSEDLRARQEAELESLRAKNEQLVESSTTRDEELAQAKRDIIKAQRSAEQQAHTLKVAKLQLKPAQEQVQKAHQVSSAQ
jgi:hypothetical protein